MGMDTKQHRKAVLYISLIIGVVVDVILRLFSGDEGNLLVHTAVFFASSTLAMLSINGIHP